MKITQNPNPSNKENYHTLDQHISRKSLPISAQNSQKVLIQHNKTTQSNHKSSKKNKQNIPIPKQSEQQNRKTIENTIKDLLKGKQDLFNYLQSQKQFISILNPQDPNIKHLSKQRGKLTSSLTEKKKSRIDNYYATKTKINPNSKKFSQYLSQNDKNSNQKIKNSAVTVEIINNRNQIKITSEPCQVETKHYQTISFDNFKTQIVEKSSQKVFKNTLTQENQPPKYCLVLTSPQKKKQKKVILKNYSNEQNFYLTKFGDANFSPWAFAKDCKNNDFDMIEMNSPVSSEKKIDRMIFDKEQSEKKGIKNDFKMYEDNMNQKSKKIQFLSRSINAKRKISTDSHSKYSVQKNQYVSSFNQIYEKDEQEIYKSALQNQKIEQKAQQIQLSQSQQRQKIIMKMLEPNKQKLSNLIKKQDQVSMMKSSQVVILNSQPGKVSQMFAPKSSLKHHMHAKRSLNKDFSFSNNEKKIFHTEIDIQTNQKMKRIVQQDKIESDKQQSQLIELKKTEQFLKQIMISKNNVSYLSNNTLQSNSKKQITKLNTTPDQKNENKFKSIAAKQSAQTRFKTYNHLKSQCVFLDTVTNFINQKGQKLNQKGQRLNKNCESDKENYSSCVQQVYYKKAKTSLDKPLHENEVYQLISSSNTKYLTQASLNGFYMINDSKIRNEKSAFVRKKRHSTMLMKNRKNSQSMQNKTEGERKRYSFSVQKEGLNSRSDLSVLQQSKGFAIVNPLTKQLYKKYVSIVQKRN